MDAADAFMFSNPARRSSSCFLSSSSTVRAYSRRCGISAARIRAYSVANAGEFTYALAHAKSAVVTGPRAASGTFWYAARPATANLLE